MKPPGIERGAVIAEERAIMNAYASRYRHSIESAGFVYQSERDAFARWMLARLRADGRRCEELCALDVGCGTAESLEPLIDAGCRRAVGLDVAESMLREATAHVAGARLVQGLVEEPPFAEHAFDVIVAALTLHHLYDPADLFALIDRCLRPGGHFFVLEYGSGVPGRAASAPSWTTRAGDAARGLVRWKNRRALARLHDGEIGFNPAHRTHSWEEIRAAMPRRDDYELRHVERGALLPAFKRALVAESALDRALAAALARVDGAIVSERGYFQWIAGRRRGVSEAAEGALPPAARGPAGSSSGSPPPNAR